MKRAEILELLKMAGYTGLSRLNKDDLTKMLDQYLNRYKYAPRYLKGLSDEEKRSKKFDIRYYILKERSNRAPYYQPVSTDVGKSTKVSKYTQAWYRLFPDAHSLPDKAKASGVPLPILKKIDEKGRAAWRGGQHRPGASQAQWGIARVNSFLTCGKTYHTADRVLAEEAKRSPKAKKHFSRVCK